MTSRPARRATLGWVTVLSVGVSLLVVAAGMVVRDRLAVADFGPIPGRTTTFASPSPSSVPPTPSVSSPSSAAEAVTTPPVPALSPPVRLEIPALGVRAAVLPVHTSDGVLGVPEDPHQLGWWAEGAQIGSRAGAVTIDGHVDSAAAGEGALFQIGTLRGGQTILVTTASGRTLRYAVTARRTYPKSGGLPAELLGTDGPARLVLITCGGPFDRASRSYLDNVVVVAVPL